MACCDSLIPKCILSNWSLGVQRLMVTECSHWGCCSAHWMPSPSLSTKYGASFPVLVPTCLFFPINSVISNTTCHVNFFCFSAIVSISSLLSILHHSLMLNVIPPFFRLWFRWHLPRVAVIAKCRLGRWDIGQPLPTLPSPPSLPPIWHVHSTVCA